MRIASKNESTREGDGHGTRAPLCESPPSSKNDRLCFLSFSPPRSVPPSKRSQAVALGQIAKLELCKIAVGHWAMVELSEFKEGRELAWSDGTKEVRYL